MQWAALEHDSHARAATVGRPCVTVRRIPAPFFLAMIGHAETYGSCRPNGTVAYSLNATAPMVLRNARRMCGRADVDSELCDDQSPQRGALGAGPWHSRRERRACSRY